jgi:small subunit ribosomal protein S1
VRVKILEIDSERRRLSLSVKRVAEQLPHIKSAAAAGAAAAGVSEELGDVPDLGLSEDVFAGPQVSGVDDLRAAVADFVPPEEAEEAPPLPEAPAEAAEPEASEPEASEPEASAAAEAEAAEPEGAAEPEPEAEEAPAEDAPADSDQPEE